MLRRRSDLSGLAAARPEEAPLDGLERWIATVRRQSVVCLGCVLGAPLVAAYDRGVALAVVSCAATVWLALQAVRRGLDWTRRERVHDLILAGQAPPVPAVSAEVRRLASAAVRRELAGALLRALEDGERWSEFLPASRPPPGVRVMGLHARRVREIAAALEAGPAPARAVVMVHRLVRGGYGSALYRGDADGLGRELGRISYELAAANVGAGGRRS